MCCVLDLKSSKREATDDQGPRHLDQDSEDQGNMEATDDQGHHHQEQDSGSPEQPADPKHHRSLCRIDEGCPALHYITIRIALLNCQILESI